MSTFTTTSEATRLPLDVRDVKNYLKLDENADEVMVRTMIVAASKYVEDHIQGSLISRGARIELNNMGFDDEVLVEGMIDGAYLPFKDRVIELQYGPVISVDSIKAYDEDDVEIDQPLSKFYIDTSSKIAKITLRKGESWPSQLRPFNCVRVDYTAGFGASPADIPEPIRLAMYQFIAFSYEHRGEFERFPPPKLPESISVMLQPYRSFRFNV